MSCSRHPQSVSPYQSTEKKSRCGGNGQKMCAKKVEMGETGWTSKNAISPMHQNLLPNNNDAQSTTKYGFLPRPDAQIVALRTHCA